MITMTTVASSSSSSALATNNDLAPSPSKMKNHSSVDDRPVRTEVNGSDPGTVNAIEPALQEQKEGVKAYKALPDQLPRRSLPNCLPAGGVGSATWPHNGRRGSASLKNCCGPNASIVPTGIIC